MPAYRKNICIKSANIFASEDFFYFPRRKKSDVAEKTKQDFVPANHKRSTNCVFL